ncbi:MAG: PadR family transcriptional regulator [Acutalibacteraceae bacterium]
MDNQKTNIKKGAMKMLVMTLLDESDMYGYEIMQKLSERSGGIIEIKEGALYHLLYKLEENNHVTTYKKTVNIRRERVYYHLEESGRELLLQIKKDYDEISRGINQILTWNEDNENKK